MFNRLYRENAIAVRVIDRSAYDATSRVHAHRQRKNLSYLRNGCCIYYLRPSGAAHLHVKSRANGIQTRIKSITNGTFGNNYMSTNYTHINNDTRIR